MNHVGKNSLELANGSGDQWNGIMKQAVANKPFEHNMTTIL